MTRSLRLVLPLAVFCLGITFLDAQPLALRPVRVAAACRSTEPIPVEAIGYMSRQVESTFAFKVPGIVESVRVRVGDTVTRGQLLARLQLDEIDAQLAQARSHAEKCRRDLARMEQLNAIAAATLEDLQNARTALESAQAELRIMQFNRRHAEIIAPDDGVVIDRLAEPDQWANAGQPIIRFGSNRDGWRVKAQLAESEVRRLQVGDDADVEGTRGVISKISDAADPITRTVAIEVDCLQRPPSARSNQVVRLILRPQPVPERAVVPASSLIASDRGRYRVFFLTRDADVAHSVHVEVESVHRGMAYLKTTLPPACARVVTQGAEYLSDGMNVLTAAPQ